MQAIISRFFIVLLLITTCYASFASETVSVSSEKLMEVNAGGSLSIEWNEMMLVGIVKRDQIDIDNLMKLKAVLADPSTDNQTDRFDKSIPIEKELPFIKSEKRSSSDDYLVFIRGAPEGPGCSIAWYPRGHKIENEILIRELTGVPWFGGFIDACTLNKYDLSGRVYKGTGARINLQIPKHHFDSEGNLIIGVSTPNKSPQPTAYGGG